MAMRTSATSIAAALVVACVSLTSADAGVSLMGLDGSPLLRDGTCATSVVDNSQKYSFNLVDAVSQQGHYSVSVKKDFTWNATEVKLNISFYFQCAFPRLTLFFASPETPSRAPPL